MIPVTAPTTVSRTEALNSSKNKKFNRNDTGIETINLHTSDLSNASFFVIINIKSGLLAEPLCYPLFILATS